MTGPRSRSSLADWLDWQQSVHPSEIELGLDRVRRVLERTGWQRPGCPVFTVGGTNGKGSCVALLDAMLGAAGYRTACFTSPHLVDYRERIVLDGRPVSSASLIAAFERISAVLGSDPLTFFEFNTLAALLVFESYGPQAIILEVGLGGRLDAVNVVDADVAVVTSVDLDHMEWLGPDIEAIAREKAGIFRAGRPAICGMRGPPQSLLDTAANCGAALRVLGKDFEAVPGPGGRWSFVERQLELRDLPLPALPGRVQLDNAASAIAAWNSIHSRLPLLRSAVEAGLRSVSLPGRFQRVRAPSGVEWVLDVAHNPQAARTLAANLGDLPPARETVGICAMLADKDVPGVLDALAPKFDRLLAAATLGPRGLTDGELADRARAAGISARPAGTLLQALEAVAASARSGDRVVVFGSFHTVGPALEWLGEQGLILPAPWMNSSRHD